ncbi:hypothetical protein [Thomasclavelia cocleata]|uniref:hypothetical protein n=1 Tax=Thomasclavelia cocleata TaxID=69824 RepID=UPI00255AFBFA|nr:hypothetical protein [Thomasclavelia cocleata]
MYVEQIDLLIKLITLNFFSKDRVNDYHNRIESNQLLLDNLQTRKNSYVSKIHELEDKKNKIEQSAYSDQKISLMGKNSVYSRKVQLVLLVFFLFTFIFFIGKSFSMILAIISNDSYYLSSNILDFIFIIIFFILGVGLFFGPKFKGNIDNRNKKKSYYDNQENRLKELNSLIYSYKDELITVDKLINQSSNTIKIDNDISYTTIQNQINPNISLTQQLIEDNPLNLGTDRIWNIEYMTSLREIFATDQADNLRDAKVILESRFQNKENIQAMTNTLKNAISELGTNINNNLIKIANEVKSQNETLAKINNDMNKNSLTMQSLQKQTNSYLDSIQSGQQDLLRSEEKTAAATTAAAAELKYFNEHRK